MGAAGSQGIGAASLGIGAINSIGNAYAESQAKRAQGIYQEGIAKMNARMAEFEANDAIDRGEYVASEIIRKSNRDLSRVRSSAKQVVGKQRVGLSAQGIEIGSGSAADIVSETRFMAKEDEIDIKYAAEIDALTVRNNAWREAWGFKAQAQNYTNQGRYAGMASRTAASNTLVTGGLNALSYGLESYSTFKNGGGSLKFGRSKVNTGGK